MKALWIRVEAHEVDSVRIEKLADALDVDAITALGHYVALGGAIAEHSPEGIIADITDGKLERWAHWSGKRGAFAKAVRAQLQNEEGEFSDWEESMGKLVERRAADRERQDARRKQIKADRERRKAESGGKSSTDNHGNVRGQSVDEPAKIRGQSVEKGPKSGATERNGTERTERDGKSGAVRESEEDRSASASLRSESGSAVTLPAGCRAFLDRFYPVAGRRRADVERQLGKLAAGEAVTDGKKQQVRAYSAGRLDEKCLEVLEESAQIRDLDKAIVVLFTKLGDTSDGAAPGQQDAHARSQPDPDEQQIATWIRDHPTDVDAIKRELADGGPVNAFADASIDAQLRARIRQRLFVHTA